MLVSMCLIWLGNPVVTVLGNVQDAGYPQIGCQKTCCQKAWATGERGLVTCLGLQQDAQFWLFDASPDIRQQTPAFVQGKQLAGVFLTHAHIGHYTGLMFLGRESMNAKSVPVFAQPRLIDFLQKEAPWRQLVELKNIDPRLMESGYPVPLTNDINVEAVAVPHRDEFSETSAFVIRGPNRSLLYLPDIDKWERWSVAIESLLDQVDYALLDGTFYAAGEIPGRNMAEIPHPFIAESLERFAPLAPETKAKIYFTHFNHTNPCLDPNSEASKTVEAAGFHLARTGQTFEL
ncbi:MAG: pyrroloquinoline quinone biosynthesis protein PqqB [Acidobacteria bacterium]|nr:pyrroloquinoline quinone biosynthesis protein PqqB [Acidobacteriota bacterium]